MKPKKIIPSVVSLEHIPILWEQNESLIFLIELDSYDKLDAQYLDDIEKRDLQSLQTRYFKNRYISSRLALKQILCSILNLKKSISCIATYKDDYGKVHVRNHEDLHICISYTENIIILAISKIEVGIDVELRRTLPLSKITKYLYTNPLHTGKAENKPDFLMAWTLREAYCKFSNKNIFSSLNKEPDFYNLCCLSYILNNNYILAIITPAGQRTLKICQLVTRPLI